MSKNYYGFSNGIRLLLNYWIVIVIYYLK